MPSIDLSNPTYIINDVPVAMEIRDDPDDQANVKVDLEPVDWRDEIKLYIADDKVPTGVGKLND